MTALSVVSTTGTLYSVTYAEDPQDECDAVVTFSNPVTGRRAHEYTAPQIAGGRGALCLDMGAMELVSADDMERIRAWLVEESTPRPAVVAGWHVAYVGKGEHVLASTLGPRQYVWISDATYERRRLPQVGRPAYVAVYATDSDFLSALADGTFPTAEEAAAWADGYCLGRWAALHEGPDNA